VKRSTSGPLAALGHELRNPINALRINLEVLRQELEGGEEASNVLHRMDRQLAFLSSLVEDIVRSGAVAAAPAGRVRLGAIIASAVETCRHLIEGKVQEIHFPTGTPGPWVAADPLHIEQILINLLANASRYTPAGGSIRIRAGLATGGEVSIEVEDTGIGLEPEELDRLFEPGFRSSRTGAAASKGTGLGLPLSRRLAAKSGGRITASSSGPGLGSRFTLTLPGCPAEDA
jgi:signal transduction histidine kinase